MKVQPKYLDRETRGTRLNLTMIQYQEPPMVPKGGYNKPKEMTGVRAYTSPVVAVPTDHRTVQKQKAFDLNVYQKRVAQAKEAAQIETLRSKKREFTAGEASGWLDMTANSIGHLLNKWAREGKTEHTGMRGRLKLWRVI